MKKFLLFAFLGASFLNANSQVYNAGTNLTNYSDIDPDSLASYVVVPYTQKSFSLNIFPDALKDIEFMTRGAVSPGGSAAYIAVTSINPKVKISFGRLDSVFVISNSTWNVTKIAKPLNAGDQINSMTAVWESSTLYLTDHSGSGGGNKNVNDFVGGDKYLGLKYQDGANTQYGWLRVQCISEDSCYVKDFSYSGVIAGMRESLQDQMIIYPNPLSSAFYLKNVHPDSFDVSKLTLKDVYGNEVKFNYEIKNNIIKIDLGRSLVAGCYTLHYFSGEKIITQKLLKISE